MGFSSLVLEQFSWCELVHPRRGGHRPRDRQDRCCGGSKPHTFPSQGILLVYPNLKGDLPWMWVTRPKGPLGASPARLVRLSAGDTFQRKGRIKGWHANAPNAN